MELLSELTLDTDQWSPTTLNAVVAVVIAIGTLYCFLGYRTVKFAILVTGFALAGAAGAALATWISSADPLAVVFGGVFGGISGAVALLFLYKVGVFCMGMLGALLLAHNVLAAQPPEPWVPWATLGFGVIAGFIAVALERPLLTIATALLGAWAVVCGLEFFLAKPDNVDVFQAPAQPGAETSRLLIYWAVLSLAGALTQFATHPRTRKKPQPKPPP